MAHINSFQRHYIKGKSSGHDLLALIIMELETGGSDKES